MTSKERVRAAIRHEKPDRVPAAYEAVGPVNEKLLKHYGYTNMDQLLERYQVDIVPVGPRYIGPELKTRKNSRGELVVTSFWGHEARFMRPVWTPTRSPPIFPLPEWRPSTM
ncbi:MAG: hypothetical protein ACLSB9_14880 [Hydrogeniiclostridium mannosilyticum]